MHRPALSTHHLAALLGSVVLLGWLAWAQLPGHSLPFTADRATGDAEWIWAQVPRDKRSPMAFYAARDFELPAVPAGAELAILADEEYHVFVNDRWVGSGAWAPAAKLDVYRVGELLRPGTNRLLVELRSGRGNGGLLVCLTDAADGRVLVASDRSWRTPMRHANGLFRGWASLEHAPAAISWGRPPTGRWGVPQRGRARAAGRTGAGRRRTPVRARALVDGRWRALTGATLPERMTTGAPGVLLDFGEEVSGRLSLRFRRAVGGKQALLFVGMLPYDPLVPAPLQTADGGAAGDDGRSREPDAPVLAPPGRRGWSDAEARRFRYATVVGVPPVAEAWVDPAAADEAIRLPSEGASGRGLLGLTPPPLRTPVEDEVGRELQSLPGFAAGEAG